MLTAAIKQEYVYIKSQFQYNFSCWTSIPTDTEYVWPNFDNQKKDDISLTMPVFSEASTAVLHTLITLS